MFGLQSIGGGPMYASSRFGPFRHMFLRHASAVSTAIAKNISMDVVRPSQLIDPSDTFEEDHRHYSFMAVLAMMSLFLLITISITGLLLGFCRKKDSGYSRSEGKMDGSSQFELNDIDLEVDTRTCRADPHGVCYYHLSDDDMDDDDDDDDDDNGAGTSVNVKQSKKRGDRKRERKWRKMRDRGYYYHLYNNDDEDSWDGKGDCVGGSNAPDDGRAQDRPPKRSRTFPQLHNVLASCMRGHGHNAENVQYKKLQPSPTACKDAPMGTVEKSLNKNPPSHSTDASKRAYSAYAPPSSPLLSSSSDIHRHQHTQASAVQINSNSGSAYSPGGKGVRTRQAHLKQRQARNQRQPSHQLHQQSKLRPRHMQHYSSLSYHRHTKLHHAIKHNAWQKHKRVPIVRPEGGGCLYKSHSIHAIPCSEPKEPRTSAGTPESSRCKVQVKVERIDYNDEEEVHHDLLTHERV